MKAIEVLVNRKPYSVEILDGNGKNFLVKVDDKTVNVKQTSNLRNKTIVEINGKTIQAEIKEHQENTFLIKIAGKTFEVQLLPKTLKEQPTRAESFAVIPKKTVISSTVEKDAVTAPIAGRIVLVKANVGQKVEKGECLCILEAMKMENEVAAPKDGIVKEVRVSEGDVVNKRDVLAIII